VNKNNYTVKKFNFYFFFNTSCYN